jgi:hypothetical protein
MNTHMKRTERGQVVLITAAAMVVLLGIGALVVDLGMSWMLSRQEQNAADAGAIAAARHLKDEFGNATWDLPAAKADACFYAQENGFFESDDSLCSAAFASGKLSVHSPPVSGDFAGSPGTVQVIIRETHPSFFGGIFGRNVANVGNSAVAANQTADANSSSLVALQPVCVGGSAADVDGGGEIRIFPVTPGAVGGYVHVNSPCGSSLNNVCDGGGGAALSISGTLKAPYTYTVGSCSQPGGGGLQCDPPPPSGGRCLDEGVQPLADPLARMPEPTLADFPNGQCPNGGPSTPASTSGCELKRGPDCPADPLDNTRDVCTLTPGVYYGGWTVGAKVRLLLEPGMYILAGGGIGLSGTESSIEAVTNTAGVEARIMIFSTDGPGCPSIGAQCQNEIKFTSEQAFKAKALNEATCGLVSPQACPWKGILLWQDGTASNPTKPVTIGGQSSNILAGTIYAPKAQVDVSGGAAGTGCSGTTTASCLAIQIISYRWKVTGGGLVEMPYDPAGLYQLPQRGLVD